MGDPLGVSGNLSLCLIFSNTHSANCERSDDAKNGFAGVEKSCDSNINDN